MIDEKPNQNLKVFPNVATKTKVRKMYNGLSDRLVTEVIVFAIEEVNKKKTIKISKNCHNLNYHHLLIIREELGTPNGYI